MYTPEPIFQCWCDIILRYAILRYTVRYFCWNSDLYRKCGFTLANTSHSGIRNSLIRFLHVVSDDAETTSCNVSGEIENISHFVPAQDATIHKTQWNIPKQVRTWGTCAIFGDFQACLANLPPKNNLKILQYKLRYYWVEWKKSCDIFLRYAI